MLSYGTGSCGCDDNEHRLPNEMAYQRCSQYSILLNVDSGQDKQPGNCESNQKYLQTRILQCLLWVSCDWQELDLIIFES